MSVFTGMSNPEFPSTDRRLIERLVAPVPIDQEAWDRFVGVYRPVIVRLLVRQMRMPSHDAEDVTQKILLRVRQKGNQWTAKKSGRFRDWLVRVTRNYAISALRKKRRDPTVVMSIEDLDPPEDRDLESEAFDRVQAVAALTWASAKVQRVTRRTTWQAFVRTTSGRESTATVATDLNISLQDVYEARHRVQQRLAAAVEHYKCPFQPIER